MAFFRRKKSKEIIPADPNQRRAAGHQTSAERQAELDARSRERRSDGVNLIAFAKRNRERRERQLGGQGGRVAVDRGAALASVGRSSGARGRFGSDTTQDFLTPNTELQNFGDLSVLSDSGTLPTIDEILTKKRGL